MYRAPPLHPLSPDGQALAFTSTSDDGLYRICSWTPSFGMRFTPQAEQDRFPMWAR